MAFARTEDRPTMGHCSHHDSRVGSSGAPTMNLPTIARPDLADSQTSNEGDCIDGDMEPCRCCDTQHESTATHWIGKADSSPCRNSSIIGRTTTPSIILHCLCMHWQSTPGTLLRSITKDAIHIGLPMTLLWWDG